MTALDALMHAFTVYRQAIGTKTAAAIAKDQADARAEDAEKALRRAEQAFMVTMDPQPAGETLNSMVPHLDAAIRAFQDLPKPGSARPCGCDPGLGWTCARHQDEAVA